MNQPLIDAIVAMPFYGNDEGLIPAFNVYLANMPSDFYSLVEMESLSGYEALGYLSYRGPAEEAQCFMFTGASAGMMELVYREGTVNERMGTFYAEEHDCMCTNHASCTFVAEAL